MFLRAVNWLIKSRFFLILILLYIFLFLVFPTTDSDLGWHLRYGKEIWETGRLLSKDQFSWTMPGFKWFNFSWLFDALLYKLFSVYGFSVLSLLGGLISVISFYLLIKPYKMSPARLVLCAVLFVFFLEPMSRAGLRAQQFSILGIALLYFLFHKISESKKFVYSLFFPLIICFWINLHGSVSLGIAMVAFFEINQMVALIINSLNKKKNLPYRQLIYLVLSLFLSVGVLFLPFFGSDLVAQIIEHTPAERPFGIIEWLPVNFNSDIWLLTFGWTFVNAWLVFKKRKHPDGLFWAGVCIMFSYLAFSSRRMIGPYLVATMPLLLEFLQQNKNSKKLTTAALFSLAFVVAMIINGLFVRFPGMKFFRIGWNEYCEFTVRCSLKAVEYLKKNPVPSGMFNFYNYGGITIWFNPETKVFVDGRMHVWKTGRYSVYEDHDRIFFKDDFDLFEKYHFRAVYLPVTTRLFYYLKRQTNEGKWKLAFEDDRAAIFVRNK